MTSSSDAQIIREERVRRGALRLAAAQRLLNDLVACIPGGSDYRPQELPEEMAQWIGAAERNAVLSVIESCLARLIVETGRPS